MLGFGAPALLLTASTVEPVASPWGNLEGVERDGQVLPFEASFRLVDAGWSAFVQTSKYNWEGTPEFRKIPGGWASAHALEGGAVRYRIQNTVTGDGSSRSRVNVEAVRQTGGEGLFYCVRFDPARYPGATWRFLGAGQPGQDSAEAAQGFELRWSGGELVMRSNQPLKASVRRDTTDNPDELNDPVPRRRVLADRPSREVQVCFQLLAPGTPAGGAKEVVFDYVANAQVDRRPVAVELKAAERGATFAGIGGNFRMQFPAVDRAVMDYCLENLEVTWGRVAFPWDEWSLAPGVTAEAAVREGRHSEYFARQIAITRELAARKLPLILSVWVPPAWAVDQETRLPKGLRLAPERLEQAAESIASYLLYLRNDYGVEVALFSFNETDYGVEVHQTPAEHAQANRTFGEVFARRGLKTKMLLGDTGACTLSSHALIVPSEQDPAVRPYLGAVSFHSYHGVTDDALAAWSGTARRLGLPLLCAESGPDSAAHRYPLVFETARFALLEAEQLVRMGDLAQPLTIMPWQLNADYSLLAGEGIYGGSGPLRPTQRFWNFKQFSVLKGPSTWLRVMSDVEVVKVAALEEQEGGSIAVHLVNQGASRPCTLSGLPRHLRSAQRFVTDGKRAMADMGSLPVEGGSVSFIVDAQAFSTVVFKP